MSTINKFLHIALNEGTNVNDKIVEMQAANKRSCTNEDCVKEFESLKRKCDNCGSPVTKSSIVGVEVKRSRAEKNTKFDLDIQCYENRKEVIYT